MKPAIATRLALVASGLAILLAVAAVARAAETNATPDILQGLRAEHPRLLLTDRDWDVLRAAAATNSETAAILARVESLARMALTHSPLTYRKDGRRLLAVSREALRRIELWSFAHRLTGDPAFLERARKEMLNVAAFPDWNPSHFLDTAEMTAALAIGYDWLFAALPDATRAAVRKAILEKGIAPALDSRAGWNGWQNRENNWNQVCFGGLTLGALAIADDEPDRARELLERARTNNLIGLRPYAPHGIYPEGPGYWNYGTSYQVLMLSALESALGTDWNLSASPGFLASAAALVQQTGPSGRPFNFSDGGSGVSFNPALFWFARRLRQPELVCFQNKLLMEKMGRHADEEENNRFFPFLAMWTASLPGVIPPPALPLAWHGDGPNPVGVFRSSWTDTNALFLAFKGGSARNSHGHMDAGAFVLDADGERWAWDLGAQDYLSIESKGWNLWSREQNSDRWRVYRLNNFSHNTLTLGGQLHNADGDARITEFTTNSATVELSRIFAGQAGTVIRRFSLGEDRTVQVRDEISHAQPGLSVRWQMVTRAEVRVDNGRAELRQNGKRLRAELLSPPGARFEVAGAQPPADGVNQPNPDTRILVVDTPVPASGRLVLEIRLQPGPVTAGR